MVSILYYSDREYIRLAPVKESIKNNIQIKTMYIFVSPSNVMPSDTVHGAPCCKTCNAEVLVFRESLELN